MSDSSVLTAESREKVGTRPSRALRSEGRIPATLQADAENGHLDFSIDESELLAARRHHVHLYDIALSGEEHSAVIRELQWDTFGDKIIHVEFRRVTRGVEIESEIELHAVGQAAGVVNLIVSHLTIKSIPSKIPDKLEITVTGLEEGSTLKASDVELPEGVSLAGDGEIDVVTVFGSRVAQEEEAVEAEGEGEGEGDGEGEGAEPSSDGDAGE
jgi:large subunit ribosomal protein L25